jgi:hypothetical protein
MGENGNVAAGAAGDVVSTSAEFATGFATDVATGTVTGLTKDAAADAIDKRRDTPTSGDTGTD